MSEWIISAFGPLWPHVPYQEWASTVGAAATRKSIRIREDPLFKSTREPVLCLGDRFSFYLSGLPFLSPFFTVLILWYQVTITMAMSRSFKLNSGYSIPAVGLGTWQSGTNEVKEAVMAALKIGYRHIDAAAVYGNEAEVGQAIKASGVDRKDIFVRLHPNEMVMNLTDISTDYRKTLEHRS